MSDFDTAKLIDGKAIASVFLDKLSAEIKRFARPPALAVILVGQDPASKVYVGNKIKTCTRVGIQSMEFMLPETASADDVKGLIQTLNADNEIDGILLQLPLPRGLNGDQLVQYIDPSKDVDGLNILNVGKLVAGDITGFVPCTPSGALDLIQSVEKNLSGKTALIIGRSLLFGKPMAQLLLSQNCTVTMAHSRSQDLGSLCKQADIVVAAVGQPELVRGEWLKDGAIVIDVGINRLETGKLVGDVHFESAIVRARAITPVPGGVGPMTIAYLMANTVKAYKNSL